MSAPGHFRTWRIVLPESVVPSKADISQALTMVGFSYQKSDGRRVPMVLCFIQVWRASWNKTANMHVIEIAT